MADTIRFELLGPLRALRAGEELPLGPPKQRAVLAVLLHLDGRSMAYGSLVDAVWGAEPPVHVRNLVQKYVSGLRRALGEAGPEPVWTGSGYRLDGARIDDLRERAEWVRGAVAAREAGDLRRAGELAVGAESLWRGEYAEGLPGPYLEAERRRWAEKRMLALEARLQGGVALGWYEECGTNWYGWWRRIRCGSGRWRC
ncbi:winged helix-turn-helix domain-containing protein [Streptomyces sp. ISL-36]|nr:BTAD domain-containing putative transcriptional regulator [Streptomyces sp. ISL-36]MBT2442055.1 winged helix-turn-helix domain-containing protein [Streptomyces sp. ISL-36]